MGIHAQLQAVATPPMSPRVEARGFYGLFPYALVMATYSILMLVRFVLLYVVYSGYVFGSLRVGPV